MRKRRDLAKGSNLRGAPFLLDAKIQNDDEKKSSTPKTHYLPFEKRIVLHLQKCLVSSLVEISSVALDILRIFSLFGYYLP